MSVLIKDMEMPITCCHCPLMGYDPDREWFDRMARTGAHICVLTGELIDNTRREEHCPLIPVPPHGRLIDADAVIANLKAICEEAYGTDNIPGWSELVVEYLTNAPTIIQAEEGET